MVILVNMSIHEHGSIAALILLRELPYLKQCCVKYNKDK